MDNVGTGAEQVLELRVNSHCIVHCRRRVGLVVIVLCLLRHRERPRHSDLYLLRGVGFEKFHIAHLYRVFAANRADDTWYRIWMSGPIERFARIVDVDSLKRRCKAVRIALAPHFAVGDDVQPRFLLLANDEASRIVLCIVEKLRRDSPQLLQSNARWKATREVFTINQSFRLRIAADQCRGKEHCSKPFCKMMP